MGGWGFASLGDVCHVIGGGTPSKKNNKFYSGSIPWATIRDMNTGVISKTNFHITEDAVRASSTNIIPGGNVIIATRVGLGKICLLLKDTAINQDLRGIVPKQTGSLSPRYLFYWFKTVAPRIIAAGTGATVQGVKVDFVKSLALPLPPLPEQERIVAILDEAFAAIATATANAEKNLANARELFESQLEVSQSLTGRAPTVPLAELCHADRVITYGVIKLGKEVPDGAPCLRTSNVKRLSIDIDGMKRISESISADFRRTILEGGEVLVNVRGTLGGVAVVSDSMAGWNVSREVAVVPVNHALADPNYLAFCIASKSSQEWLTGVVKGVAYKGINIADLRTLPIPVPSGEEQQQVVARVRDAQQFNNSLESISAKKLSLLVDLKQSILQKAFTGELTNAEGEG